MGENTKLSFNKSEHLKNIKLIDNIFKNPVSVKSFPLIFSFKSADYPTETPLQVLFTVSKRNFKRAVDRNRIKRLMRDRLRLRKPELITALKGKKVYAALIYTSKEMPEYRVLDQSIEKLIKKLHETP